MTQHEDFGESPHDFGAAHDYSGGPTHPRRAARESRTHELRRALGLTALAIVPGAGLTFTRRRRLGVIFLALTLLVFLGIAYLFVSQGLVHGVTQFLTKRGLWILAALILGGAILALVSVILTYRETHRRAWPSRTSLLHRVVAILACLVVVVPAAQATRYVAITRDAFTKMHMDRFTGRGGVVHKPGSGSDPWKDVSRVNVLLLGSDAGADRYGQRTDSVTVASINTRTGDTVLMTIPRNLQDVPFPATNPLHALWPDGFYCPQRVGNECMMDAVWMEAVNHKDLFASNETNPGLDTTREVVQEILGINIDYTAIVDFNGFQQIVDAMGGVWVNVPGPEPGIPIGGKIEGGVIVPGSIRGYIHPGYQKLDGYHALWYSRSRVGNAAGDDDRARRQRCMINSLVSQANPFTMLTKFPDIMRAASDNIKMDIPQNDLPAWAELFNRMKHGNSRSVNISAAVNHVHPDFAKIRKLVQDAISKPHDNSAPTPAKPPTPSATPSTTPSTTTAGPTDKSGSATSSSTTEDISNTADAC